MEKRIQAKEKKSPFCAEAFFLKKSARKFFCLLYNINNQLPPLTASQLKRGLATRNKEENV